MWLPFFHHVMCFLKTGPHQKVSVQVGFWGEFDPREQEYRTVGVNQGRKERQ